MEGVPELQKLPVLGALFRSKDFKNSESELVIVVTPYVVSPTEPNQFARPDDGFAPASELQSLLLGHLHRVYGKPGQIPPGLLKGDIGFVVDYPDLGDAG